MLNNKSRNLLAKWIVETGKTDPSVDSKKLSQDLGRALDNPKFQDVATFAASAFTHAELSQLGIPEHVLGQVKERATQFVENRMTAVNRLADQFDFMTTEQIDTAMNTFNTFTGFDKQEDSASWADRVIQRTENIATTSAELVNPTDYHNLKFASPMDADVGVFGVHDRQRGQERREFNAGTIAAQLAAKPSSPFDLIGERVDVFGIPVQRFARHDPSTDSTSYYDLSYERQTGALLWGQADQSRRYVINPTLEPEVGGPAYGKRITGSKFRDVGSNLERILSGRGKPTDYGNAMGAGSSIDIQRSSYHSLLDESRKIGIPTSFEYNLTNDPQSDKMSYQVTPSDLEFLSGEASRYSQQAYGRNELFHPLDYMKGFLRSATNTIRQTLGYYVDPAGNEMARTIGSAKDVRREYVRGTMQGFGPSTGTVYSQDVSAQMHRAGSPAAHEQLTNVFFTDDRASFAEGEAKILANRGMVNRAHTNVMYGYTMENLPFQEGDVYSKTGQAPRTITEGSRFVGKMDNDIPGFDFGNEAERRIQRVQWDDDIGAPVVHSVAGSYAGISEFKMTSGMKGQLHPVRASDPHFSAVQEQLGLTPDVIAPQASKDKRMRNIALRMFQSIQDPDTMRKYLRSASAGKLNDEQFEEAFGSTGPVAISGGRGDIVADAATMFLMKERGVEYTTHGQRISASDWDTFRESRKAVYGEDSGILSSKPVMGPQGNVQYYMADYKSRGVHGDIMGDWLPNNISGETELSSDFLSTFAANQPEAFDMLMEKGNIRPSSQMKLARGLLANSQTARGKLQGFAQSIRDKMEFVNVQDMDIDEVRTMVESKYGTSMNKPELESAVLSELGKRYKGQHIMANGMVLLPADVMAQNYSIDDRKSQNILGPKAFDLLMGTYNRDVKGVESTDLKAASQEYIRAIQTTLKKSDNLKKLGTVSLSTFGGPARGIAGLPGDMSVVREEDMIRVLRENYGDNLTREDIDEFRRGNMYGTMNMPAGQRNLAFAGTRIVSQEWLRGDMLDEAGFWDEFQSEAGDIQDPAQRVSVGKTVLQRMIRENESRIGKIESTSGLYNETASKRLKRRNAALSGYMESFDEFGVDFFSGFGNIELAPQTVGSSPDFYRANNKDFDTDLAPSLIPVPGLRREQLRKSFIGDWASRSRLSTGDETGASQSKFGRDLFDILGMDELSIEKSLTAQKILETDLPGAAATKGMQDSYRPFVKNMYAAMMDMATKMGLDENQLAQMKNAAGMAGDVVYQPYMDKQVIDSFASRTIITGRGKIRLGLHDDEEKFGLNMIGYGIGQKLGNRVDFEETMMDMMSTSGMRIYTGDESEIYTKRGGVVDSMAMMLARQGDIDDPERLEAIRGQLMSLYENNRRADAGLFMETPTDEKPKPSQYLSRAGGLSEKQRRELLTAITGREINDDNYRQELRKYVMGIDEGGQGSLENMSTMSYWTMSEISRNTLNVNEEKESQVSLRDQTLATMTSEHINWMRNLSETGVALDDAHELHKGSVGIRGALQRAQALIKNPVTRGASIAIQKVLGTLTSRAMGETNILNGSVDRFAVIGESGPEILDRETGEVIPGDVMNAITGGLPHQGLPRLSKFAKGTPGIEELLETFNTSSIEELANLPGIGAKLASRISEYRQESGGFNDPSDILNVKGIGRGLLGDISKRLGGFIDSDVELPEWINETSEPAFAAGLYQSMLGQGMRPGADSHKMRTRIEAQMSKMEEALTRDDRGERKWKGNLSEPTWGDESVIGSLNISNVQPLDMGDVQRLGSAYNQIRSMQTILAKDENALKGSTSFASDVAGAYSTIDEIMGKHSALSAAGFDTSIVGADEKTQRRFDYFKSNISKDAVFGTSQERFEAYKQLGKTRDIGMERTALGPEAAKTRIATENLEANRGNIDNLIAGMGDGDSQELYIAEQMLKDYNRATDQGQRTAVSATQMGVLTEAVEGAKRQGFKGISPAKASSDMQSFAPNYSVDQVPQVLQEFHDQITQLGKELPDTTKEMKNFVGTFNQVSKMYSEWNEEFQAQTKLAEAGDPQAQARLATMQRDSGTMGAVGQILQGAQGNAAAAQARVALDRFGGMSLEERSSLLTQYSQQGGATGQRRRLSREYDELRESVLNEQYGEDGLRRRVAGAMFEPAAAAERGVRRIAGTMFTTMMARNQIAMPMGQLADTFQSQEIGRQQNLMGLGMGNYSDFMSGAYGQIKRRSARNQLGMGAIGEQVYNTWGGVINAGLGETFTPILGNMAATMGPAVGAGMVANSMFDAKVGAAVGGLTYLGGSALKGIQTLNSPEAMGDMRYNIIRAGQEGGALGQLAQGIGQAFSDPFSTIATIGGAVTQSDTFLEGARQSNLRIEARQFMDEGFALEPGTSGLREYVQSRGMDNPDAARLTQRATQSYLADKFGVDPDESLRYFRTEMMYGDDLRSTNRDPIAWMRDSERLRSFGAQDMMGTAESIMQGRGFISDSEAYGSAFTGLSQRYSRVAANNGNVGIAEQQIARASEYTRMINQSQFAAGQDFIGDFELYDQGAANNEYEMGRIAQTYSSVGALRVGNEGFGSRYGDQILNNALNMGNAAETTQYLTRTQQVAGLYSGAGMLASEDNAQATAGALMQLTGDERAFSRAMAVAQGDPFEVSRKAAGMSGSQLTDRQRAMYNQIDIQTGLDPYAENISQQEMAGLQAFGGNWSGSQRAAMSSVDLSGGTMGVQSRMTDMQYGLREANYGYQRDMSMAQFAMVTGGASPLAGGGSGTFGGAMAGMVSPEVAKSLADNFERMADSTEPVSAGLEKMAEIFDKYGFDLDQGTGMGQWQLEDAQRNLSRQQQMYGIEQQGRGLELQGAGRDLRWRQFFENMGLQREQAEFGFDRKRTEMTVGRGQQRQQEGWRMEDWSFGRSKAELGFGWQQEDFDLNLRYSRGMQRRQLLRQQERAVISHSMEMSQSDRQKGRMETQEGWSSEAYQRQQEYFNKEMEFQRRSMDMRERHFREQFELEQQQFDMSKERHEQEVQWMEERWNLEDQTIQLQRQWYVFQFEQSEKMAEMSQDTAMELQDMQLALQAISQSSGMASSALTVANRELQTFIDLMPDLVDNIQELPTSFVEAGTELNTQASSTFSTIATGMSETLGRIFNTPVSKSYPAYSEPSYRESGSSSGYNAYQGSGVRGFAYGGYTGDGNKFDSAGTVHKGEYVVPQEGAPVVRGDNSMTVDELKQIRKLMERLVSMGLYNVNATIYTNDNNVRAQDTNPYDELFRSM